MIHSPEETINPLAVSAFFQKKTSVFFPYAKELKYLEIHRHATMAKEDYIIRYTLHLRLKNGEQKRVFVRGVARTDGSKRLSYRAMKTLWEYGLQKGRYSVPRPLIYRPSVKQFLYEEFPGKTLYQIMESRHDDINAHLQDAARWLAKLHNLRIQKSVPTRTLRNEEQWIKNLKALFREVKRDKITPLDVTTLLRELWERERALFQPSGFILIHNDFNPGNIIIGKKIGCIDFVDSCRFHPLVDVGTMLAYLHSPISPLVVKHRLNEKNIKRFQDTFLKTYTRSLRPPVHIKPTDIHLFQSRATIMMAMHIAKLSSKRRMFGHDVLGVLFRQAESHLKDSRKTYVKKT